MGSSSSKNKKVKAGNVQAPAAPQLSMIENSQLELKRTRDRINKFEKQLSVEIKNAIDLAKKALGENNKLLATRYLKVKKLKENQLEVINGQLMNLEELVMAIQSELQNQQFLLALKQGNSTLQTLQSQLTVDMASEILQDTEDGIRAQQEIDAKFAELSGINNDRFSELELEKELDELILKNSTASVKTTSSTSTKVSPTDLPVAPTSKATLPPEIPSSVSSLSANSSTKILVSA
jgi:charged multivesicular body protein 6